MYINTTSPSLALMVLNMRMARLEAEYAEAARAEVQVAPSANPFAGADIVEISNEARDMLNSSTIAEAIAEARCGTCDTRLYVDGSTDGTVSMQTPTHIAPGGAAAAVAAHEAEHLVNDRTAAERDGRRVVSQDLQFHTSLCPDCGRVYVSGGTARTLSVG